MWTGSSGLRTNTSCIATPGAAWVKASVADHPDLDSAGPDDHHSQSHSDGRSHRGICCSNRSHRHWRRGCGGRGSHPQPRSDHQHGFTAPSAGYPLDVAAAEADGTATTPARSDHGHAHGSGYSPDAHHARSHDHSQAADGDTVTPATLNIPFAVTPAQTAEGQAVWDSDGDRLTVGTGAGRKTLLNGEDADGADIFIFSLPGTGGGGMSPSHLPTVAEPGPWGGPGAALTAPTFPALIPMSSGYSPLIDEHRWA